MPQTLARYTRILAIVGDIVEVQVAAAQPDSDLGPTARLRTMLELRVRVQVEQRRLGLLEAAVRRVTQRVNLFDKVLIPRTRDNIKRIKVYLADNERAGVVRAKLAKKRGQVPY